MLIYLHIEAAVNNSRAPTILSIANVTRSILLNMVSARVSTFVALKDSMSTSLCKRSCFKFSYSMIRLSLDCSNSKNSWLIFSWSIKSSAIVSAALANNKLSLQTQYASIFTCDQMNLMAHNALTVAWF